jgi:hypothetical protein
MRWAPTPDVPNPPIGLMILIIIFGIMAGLWLCYMPVI